MRVHLFDWRWQDENTAQIQAVAGAQFGRKPVVKGARMSINLMSGPTCAGFMAEGTWGKCASNQTETRAKCQLCRSKEGSFVYTAFDGFDQSQLTPSDLAKIQGPHVVYFALFGPNLMKVGVSKMERKTMRQIEQGSHATLYIAQTPDGILARQIETTMRKNGLRDKIQGSQKKGLLVPSLTDETAREIMMNALEQAKTTLPDRLRPYVENPEFIGWGGHYGIPNTPIHHIKLNPGEALSGDVVGMKGTFVVLDCAGEMVCLNMKKLRGYQVDFTPRGAGISVAQTLQHALF